MPTFVMNAEFEAADLAEAFQRMSQLPTSFAPVEAPWLREFNLYQDGGVKVMLVNRSYVADDVTT